jgi:TetR/AcrR family transcriptional repressor of nem operon
MDQSVTKLRVDMSRPLSFEPDAALDSLKDLFWAKGFEGTSMQDVEAATGLKKQSLYRQFGDKRSMYLAALRRYEAVEVRDAVALLGIEGSARERVARLFTAIIDRAIAGDRRGCFLCNASIDQAQADAATDATIRAITATVATAFATALAASEPYASDRGRRASATAFLLAAHFGLRVMIRVNLPEATLRAAAREAVTAI